MNTRELQSFFSYHLGLAKYLFIHIPKNAGVAMRKSRELGNGIVSADPYFHVSRQYTRDLRSFMDVCHAIALPCRRHRPRPNSPRQMPPVSKCFWTSVTPLATCRFIGTGPFVAGIRKSIT